MIEGAHAPARRVRRWQWQWLAVVIAFALGCSSKPSGRTWKVADGSVAPLQVVVLADPEARFEHATYEASIGGESVTLIRLDATHVALIMPALAPASYDISATIDEVTYVPLTITLSAAPPIGDPVSYVGGIVNTINAHLAEVRANADSPEMLAVLDAAAANVTRFTTMFDQADAAVRGEIALLLAANENVAGAPRYRSFDSDVSRILTEGAEMAFWGAAAVLLAPLSPPLAIAAGVMFIDQAADFVAAVLVVEDSYVVIDDVASVSSDSGLPFLALTFQSDVARTLDLSGDLRTLGAGDADSMRPVIRDAFTMIEDAATIWKQVDPILDPSAGEPPIIGEAMHRTGESLDPDLLQLDPATVPAPVELAALVVGAGGVMVTFHDPRCDVDPVASRAFEFSLVYSDPLQGALDIPVSGTITCATACGGNDQPCCAGDVCSPNGCGVDGDYGSGCFAGVCGGCGGLGQRCCPGLETCCGPYVCGAVFAGFCGTSP